MMAAYAKLGRTDMLEQHHLRQIDRNPNSAWAMGNYAGFLLITKLDSAAAIKYGERALELMQYPLARNVTGLAYQVEASKALARGNRQEALSLYETSLRIGVSDDFVREYCHPFCEGIYKVALEYQRMKKT